MSVKKAVHLIRRMLQWEKFIRIGQKMYHVKMVAPKLPASPMMLYAVLVGVREEHVTMTGRHFCRVTRKFNGRTYIIDVNLDKLAIVGVKVAA